MATTRTITIKELTEGDTVIAVDGKPRPFPYLVTRVINQPEYGITRVDFAHGGLIPPCNSTTAVTINAD